MGTSRRQDDLLIRLLGHDSPGEFFDRAQIMQLKSKRFGPGDKQRQAQERYAELERILSILRTAFSVLPKRLRDAEDRLYRANSRLWELEDTIRRLSADLAEDPEDVALLKKHAEAASAIHHWNDRRSRLKAEIDKIFLWSRSELKGFNVQPEGAAHE